MKTIAFIAVVGVLSWLIRIALATALQRVLNREREGLRKLYYGQCKLEWQSGGSPTGDTHSPSKNHSAVIEAEL